MVTVLPASGVISSARQRSEQGIHKNNQTGDEVKVGFMNSPLRCCKSHHYLLTREKTLLPFVALLVTWPPDCRRELFKRRLEDRGKAHTELSTCWAHQQQEAKKLQNKLQSTIIMKAAITTVAFLILALSWTSEAVQVEVSRNHFTFLYDWWLPGLNNDILCSLEEAVTTVSIINSCRLHWRNATAANLHLWSCRVLTILNMCTSLLCILVLSLNLNLLSSTISIIFCHSSKPLIMLYFFSPRRMDCLFLWRVWRGSRFWQKALVSQDNKTHVSGWAACPSVLNPCSHRSSCPSASSEEDLLPLPD